MCKFVENCFLICRRLLLSCLNLYLKKRKSMLVPSLLWLNDVDDVTFHYVFHEVDHLTDTTTLSYFLLNSS